MAIAFKLLFALLFITFAQGNGQHCDTSSIQVQTINTGTTTGFDMVFEVDVKNLCSCTVKNVHLNGEGFATSMQVDPNFFRDDGSNGYLVNNGQEIASMASISFQYAWDHYFQMTPKSLEDEC